MRRAHRPNPPYAGPTMPLPEEVYAALQDLAQRNGVARSLHRGRPSLADLTEVLDYIRDAIVAIPFDDRIHASRTRGRRRGARLTAHDEVLWPDELNLSETQGWIWCEANWDCPLDDLDRAGLEGGEALVTDEGDGPTTIENPQVNFTLVWADNEMLNYSEGPDPGRYFLLHGRLSLHVAIRPWRDRSRVDEPATIAHSCVPREMVDDMLASGLWAHPVTTRGTLPKQKIGSWRFVGMAMPTVAPEDQSYWLPGARGGFPRRRRRRPRAARVAQDFRVGDRVVWAGEAGAIPRDWIGVVVSHEPNLEPQHYYNVRWTRPDGEQHEGHYHQSDLIDEAEADDDGAYP